MQTKTISSLFRHLGLFHWMRYLIVVAAILISAWAQWAAPLRGLAFADEWLRDHFVRAHSSVQPEKRFVIVDIDESSIASVGSWPWPRTRIASLIEALLYDYGANGIALDMVFPDTADAKGDAQLAHLAHTEPIVFAQALDYIERTSVLRIGSISGGWAVSGTFPLAKGFIANHARLNHPPLTGNIGFEPDSDGVVRHLPLLSQLDGKAYPALSLALVQCCTSFQVGLRSGAVRRVPYDRDFSSYTVIPASDILNLRVPASLIAGKLVLVGSSSLGLADSVVTPLSSNTSGVFVHAAMLSSLLDNAVATDRQKWHGKLYAFVFSVFIVLVSFFMLSRLPAAINTLLLLVASVIWIFLAYWFSLHDDSFSTSGPLASFLLLLVVAIPYHWQIAQNKARELLDALNHYVAPAVVNELLNSGQIDPLSPRLHDMTTLVVDMEGYTKHIEDLPLDEAASVTREFLDCLTQPVLKCRGTLDRYTGDGLIAFWGAPIHDEDHADLALEAAKLMVQSIQSLNFSRKLLGKPELRIRIGIESGIAMSGNFGSSSRSIYTAVGDSVNTASRLEDMARNFTFDIIIGPGSAQRIRRHQLISLGVVQLRGKKTSTELFTLGHPENFA